MDTAQLIVSSLALVFGAWAFWQHGGRQITAAGVFSMSSAIFVGYAGLYWWSQAGVVDATMVAATSACYFTHVLLYCGFWRRHGLAIRQEATPAADPAILRGGAVTGAALALIGAAAAAGGVGPPILAGSVSFVGVTLLCVCVFNLPHAPGGTPGLRRILLVVGAFGLYAHYVFGGFGRLVLASLAFCIVAAACVHVKGRGAKALVLAATAPALWVLVQAREALGRTMYGETGLDGLGSITAPLHLFARMLAEGDDLPRAYGSTFWAALVTQVPRELWASKPPGLGLVLAEHFAPQLASIGGTLAPLSAGEWFYNFGLLGVALMIPVLGLAIRLADTWLIRVVRRPLQTRTRLLSLTAAIITAGGIGDLLWGGTHTYNGRTGTRLLVLLAMALTWARLRTREPGTPGHGAPTDGRRWRAGLRHGR
ncbi:hypothetical protein GCM10023317_23770 [Actinopolymorpha pittospori]